MIHKIIILLIALFLMNTELLWSQTAPAPAPAGPAGGGAAGQAPSPADFPQYIVTPRDDLDNYDYSNMNKSNFNGNRKDLSNFDKTNVKQNNVDVNAELQKMEEERKKASMPKEGDEAANTTEPDMNVDQSDTASQGSEYVQPNKKISLYKWYDDDGILHVTDDFGSIPPEYQENAFKSEQ